MGFIKWIFSWFSDLKERAGGMETVLCHSCHVRHWGGGVHTQQKTQGSGASACFLPWRQSLSFIHPSILHALLHSTNLLRSHCASDTVSEMRRAGFCSHGATFRGAGRGDKCANQIGEKILRGALENNFSKCSETHTKGVSQCSRRQRTH